MKVKLMLGDCLEQMKKIPDNFCDSIVTDPPYGLKFMGKKWDYDVPKVEIWKEALRVLKPGGHLLSFGGTRTYHRMTVNIEDAGFEIRDCIMWIYGSGFPKSLNIGKEYDKKMNNEREIVGTSKYIRTAPIHGGGQSIGIHDNITKGTSEFEGWGTSLKPAVEPVVLARKPISEKTIVDNCIKWKTGGINIDESRIETSDELGRYNPRDSKDTDAVCFLGFKSGFKNFGTTGRFPANIILDEEAGKMLDEQSDFSNDQGGASRFFYCAKISKKDRNEGCEEFKNNHPTVKPTKLMEYLIKLITPKGGVVLDPFMGSGSTGKAAVRNKFNFIGIEMNQEYLDIAKARINFENDK
jgi:DNA modification methylase